MIKIKDNSDCCGCSACVSVCPKNCITMKADSEGFRYPETDASVCINCGLCERTCPILNVKADVEEVRQVPYIAYLRDEEVRLGSSSGGLFSSLAADTLSRGGIVFGAAFDEENMVYHTAAHDLGELSALRGSKYVQSRIGDSYKVVKKVLEQGKEVLFTGTGCQIAGLKSYLNKEYDKLLTVDVVCHGVPSLLLWERYLDELQDKNGAKACRVNFRDKSTVWKHYSVSVDFKNGKKYTCDHSNDPYIKLFVNNICLRPSCHKCRFKPIRSQADITIGDCWGIEGYMPEMDDDKGVTLVLVHTAAGSAVLQRVKEDLEIREADADKVLQEMIYRSPIAHLRRDRFFADLSKGASMEDMIKLIPVNTFERVIWKAKRMLKH